MDRRYPPLQKNQQRQNNVNLWKFILHLLINCLNMLLLVSWGFKIYKTFSTVCTQNLFKLNSKLTWICCFVHLQRQIWCTVLNFDVNVFTTSRKSWLPSTKSKTSKSRSQQRDFWHPFIIYHELLQLKHNYNHKNLTFFKDVPCQYILIVVLWWSSLQDMK